MQGEKMTPCPQCGGHNVFGKTCEVCGGKVMISESDFRKFAKAMTQGQQQAATPHESTEVHPAQPS